MVSAPMYRGIPTTTQAERIHRVFDALVAEHPDDTELLRGVERVIIQQPDDDGPGFPEPVEARVRDIVAGVLGAGTAAKRRLRKTLRET
jgi:hypothetical protein